MHVDASTDDCKEKTKHKLNLKKNLIKGGGHRCACVACKHGWW